MNKEFKEGLELSRKLYSLRICLSLAKHDCRECIYYKDKKLKSGETYQCIHKLYHDIIEVIYGSK